MKRIKKMMALVIAMVMVVGMSTMAMAAETNTSTQSTYNVNATISNVKTGNTVNFYRIADFNLDADTNAFSYTLASTLPAAYDTIDELGAITSDGYVFTDGSAAKACADALAYAIASGTLTPNATINTEVASGDTITQALPAGWYVVTVSGTEDTSLIYQNMIINALPVVDEDNNTYKAADAVSFEVKSSPVTITKGVGDNPDHTADVDTTDEYSVGDTVPFEIKTNIPNYPNPSKEASFVIGDTPTNMTDTVTTVTVAVAGDSATGSTAGSISGKFTVAADGDGFTVTFEKDYILAHPGAAVTVNYDAVISESATIANDGETASNTGSITFNPNPNESTTVEPEDETKLYTYGVTVLKYDEDKGTSSPLKGASFKLVAANAGKTAPADPEVVVRAETAVNDDGQLTWDGLEAGTYYLIETVAPAGYRLDSTPRQIVLSESSATGDDPLKTGTQTYVLEDDVPNKEGATLPSTGGIGTTIFYVIGAILVIGAGVLLVTKRRMNAN